jgi:hypothetical protein
MVNICTDLMVVKVNYRVGNSVVKVNCRDSFVGDKSLICSSFGHNLKLLSMKYTGYFLVAMLIATAACAKVGDYAETGNADGDEQAGDGRISFVLPQAANGKPYITVEDIENQAAPVKVSMKSRVARLDIDDSDCTILGVDISNATPAGRMIENDYALTPPSSGRLTYSLASGDLTNSGRSFYLYPTVPGAGAMDTVITTLARLKAAASIRRLS